MSWQKIRKGIIYCVKSIVGTSMGDVAAGLTIAATAAAVVVISTSGVVFDTEELVHVQNSRALASAVSGILTLDPTQEPGINAEVTFTLQNLIDQGKITSIEDPSGTSSGDDYHAAMTKVLVKKIANPLATSGVNSTVLRYWVKLVRLDTNHVYINEAERTVANRKDYLDLTRSRVLIPDRHATGWTSGILD